MKFTSKKGFTLIELLVVVAIIGILASIVLVSLNSARAKGRDASAKGSMSSLRAAAEIWYDDHNGTYASFCPGTITMTTPSTALPGDAGTLIDAAKQETAQLPKCNSGTINFAASIKLNSGRWFCVDSGGFAGEFNLDGSGITAEPLGSATDYTCST